MAFSGEAVVLGTVRAYGGLITERGAAYVFLKPATGWETTSAYDARLAICGGAEHEIFGLAVAVSGTTIAVGAPYELRCRVGRALFPELFLWRRLIPPPGRTPHTYSQATYRRFRRREVLHRGDRLSNRLR